MRISKHQATNVQTNETIKESLPPNDQDAQDEQIDHLINSFAEQVDEASDEKQYETELDQTLIRIEK
ncbi:hypothetical protein J1N35_008076 [Gossypium stocksii]|uniref:Uncharacterized protein n=1 Tax=Gossypium stocksii TaxID=47602 RepID=A0A9D3W8L9_9ROSI|nr:hypothetical protein J1N35_008076 [Gossypium stocksii]